MDTAGMLQWFWEVLKMPFDHLTCNPIVQIHWNYSPTWNLIEEKKLNPIVTFQILFDHMRNVFQNYDSVTLQVVSTDMDTRELREKELMSVWSCLECEVWNLFGSCSKLQ